MRRETSTTRIRYFRRAASPTLAFFPWGLVPLLLLLLLFVYGATRFASQDIEAEVRQGVERELREAGLDWVDVAVDGQNVHLSGTGPATEGERAIGLARNATGPTALGALVAPVSVTGQFGEPPPPEQPPPPPPWGDVTATLHEDVLRLAGEVETEGVKARLGALGAARGLAPTTVENELTTAGEGALRAGSEGLAQRGLTALLQCVDGEMSAAEGVLRFTCQAPEERVESVLALLHAPLDDGRLGEVNVLALEAVSSCEQSMAEVMRGRTIEFDTGSAALSAASDPLLDRVAEAATTCPGALRVEGHTDDVGQLAANMTLSLARAASVVDALVGRGVPRGRLLAEGLGPTRPLAEGRSAAARARNRRIELHVITTLLTEGTDE